MKAKLWYADTGLGCCIIALKVKDAEAAEQAILREVGTHAGVKEVRLATERDISWVKAMGGYIPKLTDL